jgi:tetratricopeptide (TPR) repeat protein
MASRAVLCCIVLLVPATAYMADSPERVVPISTRSPEARALFERARTLADDERAAEADAALVEAVGRDPFFASAHALLAELRAGATGDSHRSRARALLSGLPEAERLSVEIAIGDRRPDEIVGLAALAPDDWRVQLSLAQWSRYRALDPAGARAAYERVRALRPSDAGVLEQLALLYADESRWREAHEAATARVALAPQSAAALDLRAEVLLLAGELEQAEQAFRSVLERDPVFTHARTGLASVRFHRGDWTGGLAEIVRGLETAQTAEQRAELQTALGWSQLAAGRVEEGRRTLRDAAAERDGARGWSALEAVLAVEEERWADARRSADAALAAARKAGAPEMAQRWIQLLIAASASRAGDLAAADAAVRALEAGSEALPPWITKDLTFARGHVALARGDTKAAVAAFTDRWVLNHESLADPGRAAPRPGFEQFALKGRLLAAEAYARGGDGAEAARRLDAIAGTYHRGIGAVAVRAQARQARARIPG